MNKGQLIEAVQKKLGKDTTKAAADAVEMAKRYCYVILAVGMAKRHCYVILVLLLLLVVMLNTEFYLGGGGGGVLF